LKAEGGNTRKGGKRKGTWKRWGNGRGVQKQISLNFTLIGKQEEEMGRVSEGKDEGKEKKQSGWGMDGLGVEGRSGEGVCIGWIGSRGQK